MNSERVGLRVAAVIFTIFALGHVARLLTHAQVTIGALKVPMWASVVAVFIAGALSLWFWRLSARK